MKSEESRVSEESANLAREERVDEKIVEKRTTFFFGFRKGTTSFVSLALSLTRWR
jgi:hypothetical protein